ncbi:MAG: arginine--tRNA ligase [Deltaproteobacteria bacterium]|nr:arginine--tRNA ligase [Deltaproteobacteria bacterium]
MKNKIENIIFEAAKRAFNNGELPSSDIPDVIMETPKAESHGDFSTNIAMVMASAQKMKPQKIAEIITANIADTEKILSKTEIAGPGFINFFIKASSWHPALRKIHDEYEHYGASNIGQGKKTQVEFVSANPTGPLHVGHGRGAAVGDSLANILSFCGYDVQKEYYVNDSGRQINTLGRSVYLRYKEILGEDVEFPEECYQGGYIKDIAEEIQKKKEVNLDGMDEESLISICARHASEKISEGIKNDLDAFGVEFDNWYSEQSLYDSGKVNKSIEEFKQKKIIYKKDGAWWFRTEDFGDEKDRVVVRQNGQTTYFASDIAYHKDKFERGFDHVIDVWGADHHGYIPRVNASIKATDAGDKRFDVVLVQLVNLLRGGKLVSMSTRAGEFVTLSEVVSEVGKDAARFIFLSRHHESPLDFDLEIAKTKTNDNPVYYVQYVHARIASIVRKARDNGINVSDFDDEAISMLKEPEEIRLIKSMASFPEVISISAKHMEPHRIAYYLMDLAAHFHAYYNKHRVLTDEMRIARGRLYLVLAVKKIIRNGLALLGVSSPEKM